MNDTMRMLLVLSLVTALCGGLLGAVRKLTLEKMEQQQLRYETGPAVYKVLANATNDPLNDRQVVTVNNSPVTLFEQKENGSIVAIAIETRGMGYGGPISVVTGYSVVDGNCKGIAVSRSKETPGIGTRVNDGSFTEKFNGLTLAETVALKKDGGSIDGISGATISSRGVCNAVAEAQRVFSVINSEKLLQ